MEPVAGASFPLPQPLGPPRFTEGEHRLVGHVGPPHSAEAYVLAVLLIAAATDRKP